jgi:hypothetical protein
MHFRKKFSLIFSVGENSVGQNFCGSKFCRSIFLSVNILVGQNSVGQNLSVKILSVKILVGQNSCQSKFCRSKFCRSKYSSVKILSVKCTRTLGHSLDFLVKWSRTEFSANMLGIFAFNAFWARLCQVFFQNGDQFFQETKISLFFDRQLQVFWKSLGIFFHSKLSKSTNSASRDFKKKFYLQMDVVFRKNQLSIMKFLRHWLSLALKLSMLSRMKILSPRCHMTFNIIWKNIFRQYDMSMSMYVWLCEFVSLFYLLLWVCITFP